jgi:hypothetical protein
MSSIKSAIDAGRSCAGFAAGINEATTGAEAAAET